MLTRSLPDIDFSPAQDGTVWRGCEVKLLASPLPSHTFSDAVFRSWGRVLAAVDSIQDLFKPLEPPRVIVLFVPDDDSPPLPALVGGEPENVNEVRAKEILSEGKFEIKTQLGIGEENTLTYVSLSPLLSPEIRDVTRRRRVIPPLHCLIHSFISLSHFQRSRAYPLPLLGIREDQRRLPLLNMDPTPLSAPPRATVRPRSSG